MDERAIGWWMGTCERASEQRGTVRYPSYHARRSGDGGSLGERELACAAAGGCVGARGSVGYDECAPYVCVCVCACVHGSQDQNGWTALITAARQGHNEIAQALIAGGADMNLQVC